MHPIRELARLVVPVACPGCGELDIPWCDRCASAVLQGAANPHRVESTVPRLDRLDGRAPLPVWAISRYADPVRGIIVAWKDRGRTDLDQLLAAAARIAVRTLAADCRPTPLLIVPAPANLRSQRQRGRAHLDPIARAVAQELQQLRWPNARFLRLLGRSRTALVERDQARLGSRARGVGHSLQVVPRQVRRTRPATQSVLLIDDVVTTGATLAAGQVALNTAGFAVLGALVLAAAAPPGGARGVEIGASAAPSLNCPAGHQAVSFGD